MFFSLYIPRRLKKRSITVGQTLLFFASPTRLWNCLDHNVMNMANESNFIHQIKWRKFFFLQGGFLQL